MRLFCGLALMAAMGCGRGTGGPDLSKLPTKATRTYDGQNANHWGPLLLDADAMVSFKASAALYQCGKDGLRYFAKGMQSDLEHVRFQSAGTFHDSAKDYPEAFVPLLRDLLKDPSPRVRHTAAARIAVMRFAELFPDVRAACASESDQEAKTNMARAVEIIDGTKQK